MSLAGSVTAGRGSPLDQASPRGRPPTHARGGHECPRPARAETRLDARAPGGWVPSPTDGGEAELERVLG
jgi:hypothetical protein